MKVRYKNSGIEAASSQFNIHALAEVLTGDDSAYISELDVLVDGEWVDMNEAFRTRRIIPNNENTHFGVPRSDKDRERGWGDF